MTEVVAAALARIWLAVTKTASGVDVFSKVQAL
jgi:hypothetical protein